ncbi:MAG: IclR family transcriptional regulator [Clostridium sp.]|jgi:DNA-binding IclR family transcriptional regulator|uniref:IclR family transcriptional regulator n=1 Tax=Clostridium sp. TaxID=1506 RepID=UPI0025B88E59|nr:IclR family transcriptional regulator [Clostridium sp.]MCH3963443.1 IclR family transcriptional regulator [Clostridium sp.]MCI1716689.1 IclR family transcriptional regulator [Clostridium sp.]MCI1801127.1 IclR family transcriptional regulator [Clostridium sp.]MCI1814875.1 IclR family transcriptional regulator [Clostridium sp.]MCI1871776.1 IclR family transcriptional regulator [Clostridium sp.]
MTSNEHRPTKRVLDILELLSNNSNGMTLTEISKALDAPKSSIMPLVHTMTSRKFIYMQKETSKYFIGIATFSVGSSYDNHTGALQLIKTEMKNIVSVINETCQLGIQIRNNLLYIAKEDSAEPIRLVSYVGKQLPLYCTAIGRAILAEKSKEEVYNLYPEGLKAFTPNTITDWDRLFEELEKTRARGYSIEHEESTPLVNCIGISLCSKKQTIAALSVCIPTFRFSEKKLETTIKVLKSSKKKLETYFQNCNIDLGNL